MVSEALRKMPFLFSKSAQFSAFSSESINDNLNWNELINKSISEVACIAFTFSDSSTLEKMRSMRFPNNIFFLFFCQTVSRHFYSLRLRKEPPALRYYVKKSRSAKDNPAFYLLLQQLEKRLGFGAHLAVSKLPRRCCLL